MTSNVVQLKQPKPMSTEEYKRCIEIIGWGEARVRAAVGLKLRSFRKKIQPEYFTLQQVRCIRFLTMNREIREWVEKLEQAFPGTVMVAVRPVPTPGESPKKS